MTSPVRNCFGTPSRNSFIHVELEPEQPEEVVRAVAELLRTAGEPQPDPWWQAGLGEDLAGEA